MLREFNEGGTHQQNPLGGIPLGQNNMGQPVTVEQGETAMNTPKGDFVFSDRVLVDNGTANSLGLPKSFVGKTMADASKFINRKFEGRHDNISNSTKQKMLDNLASSQEIVKAEMQAQHAKVMEANSVDMQPDGPVPAGMEAFVGEPQMFLGGLKDLTTGQLSAGAGLGQVALGAVTQGQPSTVASIGSGALSGASAGAALGPWGAAAGAVIGGVSGIIQGSAQKKAHERVLNANTYGQVKANADNYALGGLIADQLPPSLGNAGKPFYEIVGNGRTKPTATTTVKPSNTATIVKPVVNNTQWTMPNVTTPTPSTITPTSNKPVARKSTVNNVKTKPTVVHPTVKAIIPETVNPYNFKPEVNMTNKDGIQFAQANTAVASESVQRALNPETPESRPDNYLSALRYAPVLGNALQLYNLEKPSMASPMLNESVAQRRYVDEAGIVRNADNATNATVRALGESGVSGGALRANILGAGLNRQRALGEAYANADAVNRSVDDRADAIDRDTELRNNAERARVKENFDRDLGAYLTRKSQLQSQLGNDIGNIGKEEVYKDLALEATGYTWDGKYHKDKNGNRISDALYKKLFGEKTDSKAIGGYIFRKR